MVTVLIEPLFFHVPYVNLVKRSCSLQALIWAAQHGHKNVIFKLLELGADKNLQTKDEKTAAEIAKINKYSEVFNFSLKCIICDLPQKSDH